MTVADDDDMLVASGNLAEDACSGAGEEEGGGCEMKKRGAVPPGALWFCSESDDKGKDEDGPSRRSRVRKVRERRSEGGLQQGQEENQATDAPCVTVHLHMVVELGELWRCSGAGAC